MGDSKVASVQPFIVLEMVKDKEMWSCDRCAIERELLGKPKVPSRKLYSNSGGQSNWIRHFETHHAAFMNEIKLKGTQKRQTAIHKKKKISSFLNSAGPSSAAPAAATLLPESVPHTDPETPVIIIEESADQVMVRKECDIIQGITKRGGGKVQATIEQTIQSKYSCTLNIIFYSQ